eukprot:scaffold85606_cov59-Phaeocystis_antarctica.AAC.2
MFALESNCRGQSPRILPRAVSQEPEGSHREPRAVAVSWLYLERVLAPARAVLISHIICRWGLKRHGTRTVRIKTPQSMRVDAQAPPLRLFKKDANCHSGTPL